MVGAAVTPGAVAAVDIGTNSVRLLVAGPEGDLHREAVVTGLGRGVSRTGRLSPEGRVATLEVLARYRKLMEEAGVVQARAVATSASRDGADAAEFVAEMTAVLGIEPEVISGSEEAALSYAGAAADLADGDCLVVDIGGGSTEFITRAGGASFDVGSVRITDRFLPDRPVQGSQLDAARAWVRDVVEVEAVALPVIGVAGTWTSLAALDRRLEPYSDAAVHHTELSASAIEGWVARLASLPIEETAHLPGLDPARATVILGGALVAATCLQLLGADRVLISSHDLLDGVVAALAQA